MWVRGSLLIALAAVTGVGAGAQTLPSRPQPPPPVKELPIGEGRLALIQVSRSASATLPAPQPPPAGYSLFTPGLATLQMRFELRGPENWEDALHAVAECLMEDDRGNLYRANTFSPTPIAPVASPITRPPGVAPPPRSFTLFVPGIDPKAKSLRWIHGLLLRHSGGTRVRHEFPFQPGGGPITRSASGLETTLESSQPAPNQVRLKWLHRRLDPAIIVWQSSRLYSQKTELLSAAGEPIQSTSRGSSASGRPDQLDITETITNPREMPAKIVVEVLVLTQGKTALPFLMADVPLPGAGLGRATKARLTHPFMDEGSEAKVRVRVRRQGEPPGRGILSLALTPQAAGTRPSQPVSARLPQPLRWIDLRPDRSGRVELEHVRPGEYTMRWQWRPAPGGDAPPPILEGDPVPVRVTEGRRTTVPVLDLGGAREVRPDLS